MKMKKIEDYVPQHMITEGDTVYYISIIEYPPTNGPHMVDIFKTKKALKEHEAEVAEYLFDYDLEMRSTKVNANALTYFIHLLYTNYDLQKELDRPTFH